MTIDWSQIKDNLALELTSAEPYRRFLAETLVKFPNELERESYFHHELLNNGSFLQTHIKSIFRTAIEEMRGQMLNPGLLNHLRQVFNTTIQKNYLPFHSLQHITINERNEIEITLDVEQPEGFEAINIHFRINR